MMASKPICIEVALSPVGLTWLNRLRSPPETGYLLKINAPHWFRRKDFGGEIITRVADRSSQAPVLATWHRDGEGLGDFSDIFVTYDHGEGSDVDWIPNDIWEIICIECERVGYNYCLVWITNLEED